MSRSKRKHSTHLQASPSDPAGGGIERKIQAPPFPREVFKPLFEKALAVAKGKLQATGRIGTMALFVYGKDPAGSQEEKTTYVSLSYKDEFHKEAVRQKMQEKVVAESALAVVLLVPDPKGRERGFLISGAMPDMAADASITYTLDKESKTYSFSEMAWRDEPARNFFLEGLFSAPATRETG